MREIGTFLTSFSQKIWKFWSIALKLSEFEIIFKADQTFGLTGFEICQTQNKLMELNVAGLVAFRYNQIQIKNSISQNLADF